MSKHPPSIAIDDVSSGCTHSMCDESPYMLCNQNLAIKIWVHRCHSYIC